MIRLAASLLAASLLVLAGTSSAAFAQLTSTPGPGGIPIAPGAPLNGYVPGGVGLGGIQIAPGAGAARVPMYREGPAGGPVLVVPNAAAGTGGGGAGAAGGTGAALGGTSARMAPCVGQACLPEGLRLTIDSSDIPGEREPGSAIDSMAALHAALRACWTPPADTQQSDVEMSVRFSYRSSGALMGPPFVTYATRGLKAETRQEVRQAITAAIERCAPVKFSPAFASAVAGRPLSVRFVDHRRSDGGAR